jgi:hypothetical protein
MWKAFQRYRALDPEAQKLFWRAVTLLPWIALSLRLRGFQRTRERLARRLNPVPSATPETAETVRKTCRMVQSGVHHGLGHPTCLEQSLVLWYLLQKQNIPACFRIGVRKLPGKFEAHAWVEYDGAPLNQGEEVHHHYAAFETEFADLPGDNA